MSDLINRKALWEALKNNGTFLMRDGTTESDFIYYSDALELVANAPAVEQDKPVAIASQHYEYSGKGYGSVATDQLDITLTAYGAKTVRIGSKLYTAPPQPQTVKDALEEAARICDECGYGWAGVY